MTKTGLVATTDGGLDGLDESLSRIADAGFTHAELSPGGFGLLVAGRIDRDRLNRLGAVCDRHREKLTYTVHGPLQANLFDLGDHDVHHNLVRSGLEVTHAIGAKLMVHHAGQRQPWPAGSTRSMRELITCEGAILATLADEAAEWGGQIAVETWDTSNGYDAYGFSYAAWPDMLAAAVEAIDRPNVGICLDTGHLWAASNWYGFDFWAGVRRLAPHVIHFHLTDNYRGTPSRFPLADADLGVGDQHLAPGRGEIPFADIFATVEFPRSPVLLVEVSWRTNPELLTDMRQTLEAWVAREDASPRAANETRAECPRDPNESVIS